MTGNSRLAEIVDQLIDAWCERRALRPLSILLPAYVGFTGLTDGWTELHEALRSCRAMRRDELNLDERELLGEAIAITYQALKRAGEAVES